MTKTCTSCFFKNFSKDQHPCQTCDDYKNYVTDSDIFWSDKPVTDKYQPTDALVGWDDWPFPSPKESWINTLQSPGHDPVEAPKHYMLFPEKGIEVRHVIEKLVEKVDAEDFPQVPPGAMFFADYAQMLQYVMRFMEKNGLEDLKKAQWYLNKMIEAYEPSSAA